MKKIVFLSLLATFLMGENNSISVKKNSFLQNPKVYSALGNIIYNNVEKIEKLKGLARYFQLNEKIDSYVKEVRVVKNMGYAIEDRDNVEEKKEYLQKIRALSKIHDFFYRTLTNSFKEAIVSKNNEFFSQTINSGLVDTHRYKNEILQYYYQHATDINRSGVIQKYLDKENQDVLNIITKKQIQELKIKRLRRNDKLKQAKIQKALEEELLKKKSKIYKEQMQELLK